MAIFTRKTLFSLTLGGLVSTTTAWSQEPAAPAGSTEATPAPAATSDLPGIIHVSDCPPGESGGFGSHFGKLDDGHHHSCPDFVPPDSGWNEPGRRPIRRSWVPYHQFFPASWTGAATPAPQQRAPLVYMPTDTTQLGYYYQHVPTWHSYAGMIPPVPRPADWHYIYHPPVYGNGQPTPQVAPTPVPDNVEPVKPAPAVPDSTTIDDTTVLDRSAEFPNLTPIPR